MEPQYPLGRMLVGWREWLALPGLGVPAIKAKVDTGARTSALHTAGIETFRKDGVDMARFVLHPLRRRPDIEYLCEAEVIDERRVSDSGGHRETRLFIRTDIRMGGLCFKANISLTNREKMLFRMLLGRRAMEGRMLVDPEASHLTGKELSRAYKKTIKEP